MKPSSIADDGAGDPANTNPASAGATLSESASPPTPSGQIVLNAALILAIILLAGLTAPAAKSALNDLPALSTGFVRFGLAGLLLLLTAFGSQLVKRTQEPRLRQRDAWRWILAAVLCVPANQYFFLVGTQLANASHSGLFYALNPVLTFLITVAIGHTRWSLRMALASILAFIGTATLFFDGAVRSGAMTDPNANFLLGDLLLFGAVATFAAYSVTVLPLAKEYGASRAAGIVMTAGAILYAPVWWIDGSGFRLAAASSAAIIGFLFITIGTSYVNYALWFVALRRLEINRLSIAVNAAPIIAVVASWLLLGEHLTSYLGVSGLLLLLAIGLANWDRLRAILRNRSTPQRPS